MANKDDNRTNQISHRTNQDMEQALNQLMVQFRQINRKYGLMIGEEIKEMYTEKSFLIHTSKGYLDNLEKKMTP